MSVTGIDQSWGFANPKAAKRAGVQVVAMYLSWDSSKNATAGKVKAYHRVGIGWAPNWESQAGAPLRGAAQGRKDATEAVRQVRALIRAVGYAPRSRLSILFSCDTDVTSGQIAGPVAAYYRAAREVCHAAGFGVGVYGEFALVEYLARHGITDSEWQTYAWSGGRLSKVTDFYQFRNGQTLGGASVDFDRVIHPADIGVWWPPAHPLNRSAATVAAPSLLEVIMSLDPKSPEYKRLTADIAKAVWGNDMAPSGSAWTHLTQIHAHARAANQKAAAAVTLLSAAKTGVLDRISSLQATVAKLPAVTTGGGTVDVHALAEAVVAKIRSTITWKAS